MHQSHERLAEGSLPPGHALQESRARSTSGIVAPRVFRYAALCACAVQGTLEQLLFAIVTRSVLHRILPLAAPTRRQVAHPAARAVAQEHVGTKGSQEGMSGQQPVAHDGVSA